MSDMSKMKPAFQAESGAENGDVSTATPVLAATNGGIEAEVRSAAAAVKNSLDRLAQAFRAAGAQAVAISASCASVPALEPPLQFEYTSVPGDETAGVRPHQPTIFGVCPSTAPSASA